MKPELRESEEMCFYTAMHKKMQQHEVFFVKKNER